jgi:hypothetical protein
VESGGWTNVHEVVMDGARIDQFCIDIAGG